MPSRNAPSWKRFDSRSKKRGIDHSHTHTLIRKKMYDPTVTRFFFRTPVCTISDAWCPSYIIEGQTRHQLSPRKSLNILRCFYVPQMSVTSTKLGFNIFRNFKRGNTCSDSHYNAFDILDSRIRSICNVEVVWYICSKHY